MIGIAGRLLAVGAAYFGTSYDRQNTLANSFKTKVGVSESVSRRCTTSVALVKGKAAETLALINPGPNCGVRIERGERVRGASGPAKDGQVKRGAVDSGGSGQGDAYR